MDLKAIEAALESIDELAILRRDHPGDIGAARGFVARSQGVMLQYGPDLLRFVRAMAFIEAHPEMTLHSCGGDGWCLCQVHRQKHTGPTIIDAIEAAIMADQQTKGASDEA